VGRDGYESGVGSRDGGLSRLVSIQWYKVPRDRCQRLGGTGKCTIWVSIIVVVVVVVVIVIISDAGVCACVCVCVCVRARPLHLRLILPFAGCGCARRHGCGGLSRYIGDTRND